ncbi:MAG: hypothetical protein R2822_05005 [Spirosomataceae bacterium]
MTANIVDRQVAALETVETPAGKLSAPKSYTLNMKLFGNHYHDLCRIPRQGYRGGKIRKL